MRTCFPLLCLLIPFARAERIANPTRHPTDAALVRLKTPPPSAPFGVLKDGVAVAHQAEGTNVWISLDLEPGASAEYQYTAKTTVQKTGAPWVERVGDHYVLRNAKLAIRMPAVASAGAPILAFQREGGPWQGAGAWEGPGIPTDFKATVLGDGPLFAKVRLDYTFPEGRYGIVVILPPNKPYAEIHEEHAMRGGDGWRFHLGAGWAPSEGIVRRWYKGPFEGAPAEERFPLRPGQTRLGDTLIHLQPRWTQGYDQAWFFAATDGQALAGALVLRAGDWRWPHDNLPRVDVRNDGKTADLFLPTHRGQRTWLLLAGAADLAAAAPAIARAENVLRADKLYHRYRLPFAEGDKARLIGGQDFYSNQTNPTGMMRQQARALVREVRDGKTRMALGDLYQAQAGFDPDWYGLYEHQWSPINPNFYTDFIKGPIAMAMLLRNHPEFPHLRKLAEEALRRDVDHSVTLPGGAGQECPGYLEHAMGAWKDLAPLCAQHLGFDPREWPRYTEAARFIARVSQPDGPGKRKFHPGGDTHPGRPDPLALARDFGVNENPSSWTSEELPGFGAVLRHRSGSPRETYFAFKAGPNRGHFHGDQLSFHYNANARPLAVDHHCSYKPRAGQEHMHNRVSFSTPGMPYANMDGHERLIAFATGPLADVAMGQVESPRMREVKPLPPEDWDVSEPQVVFDQGLVYRRTVVLVKGSPDYLVLRDEHRGPALTATYNLHVLGDRAERDGAWIRFEGLNAFVAKPAAFRYDTLSWQHENGGLEKTTAARISQDGAATEFITLLATEPVQASPLPDGVRVGGDEIRFGADGAVRLIRAGVETVLLKAHDIDLDRPQGKIGLFVPTVGYPFGPIPDWLIRQRVPSP